MADAAYNLRWYEWDTRRWKSILMIMSVSQNGVILEVPFFVISYETIAGVCTFFF